MKLLSFILTLVLFATHAGAQNIVPNHSFETYISCPSTLSQVTTNCTAWYQYTNGTCDYFNACGLMAVDVPENNFGYQPAYGNAYTGLYCYLGGNYVEYLAINIPPMQVGIKYEVSMSVALAEISAFATDGLGVHFFSTGPSFVATTGLLQVTPQVSFNSYGPIADTLNWTRLKGIFTADSAYSHLVLGNFKDNSLLIKQPTNFQATFIGASYYYIDSVVVRIADYTDFTYSGNHCPGDTIHVPYNVHGSFSAGNVFALQLSDEYGNFSNPLDIGILSSVASGSIAGVIPVSIPPGSNYRLRIVSTNPASVSDPGPPFSIWQSPVVTATANTPVCENEVLRLSGTSSYPATLFKWHGPNGFSSTEASPAITGLSAGSGGDYIVSGTLGNCTSHDTIKVTVKAAPSIMITSRSHICRGDSLRLDAESIPVGLPFSWVGPAFSSPYQNNIIPGAAAQHAGKYRVTTTLDGCNALAEVDIAVDSLPPSSLGDDPTICRNTSVVLGIQQDNVSYLWSTGETGCCITVTQPGMYSLVRSNICGTATDSVFVTAVNCDSCLVAPSAFTPNGDGKNDGFSPLPLCGLKEYSFKVFNRWGQVLFSASSPGLKWDGTVNGVSADIGTYFYMVEYVPDIPVEKPPKRIAKGDVSLIR